LRFSAVYRAGGSKSLPLFTPETGGGSRAKNRSFKRCAENCPANAITVENGKDHYKCHAFVNKTGEKYKPRFGCGKCQTGVPCESRIP